MSSDSVQRSELNTDLCNNFATRAERGLSLSTSCNVRHRHHPYLDGRGWGGCNSSDQEWKQRRQKNVPLRNAEAVLLPNDEVRLTIDCEVCVADVWFDGKTWTYIDPTRQPPGARDGVRNGVVAHRRYNRGPGVSREQLANPPGIVLDAVQLDIRILELESV